MEQTTAYYHLPGLFEFHELYATFLRLYREHRDWFYNWCEIGSIYGAPKDALWGGGRVGFGDQEVSDVLALMDTYQIPARLTFSNSLLRPEHLLDKRCNELCQLFAQNDKNGIILHSDLLLAYIQKNYPTLHRVSSTTKVITGFEDFRKELDRKEYETVVPDFRLNRALDKLGTLTDKQKDKVEFLVNECCYIGCKDRKACYENVSRKSLGEDCEDHVCASPYANEGYRFSRAMKSPAFISVEDIQKTYLNMGFSQFKIEGRSLGSAMVLEFLLYYMTKPEFQINVREEIYLDSTLDLF